MSNVVDISSRRHDPHMTGKAKCLQCSHEWIAVAPVGTSEMECPSCSATKGFWRHLCNFESASAVFVCVICGCQAITAARYPDGVHLMCMGCGAEQTEAVYA
jgi:hypothetical protein